MGLEARAKHRRRERITVKPPIELPEFGSFSSVAFVSDLSPGNSKNAMVVGCSWLGFTPTAMRRDPRYRRR
jgi:hypothetical protein